jgi:hypothetical protein
MNKLRRFRGIWSRNRAQRDRRNGRSNWTISRADGIRVFKLSAPTGMAR